MTDSRPMFPGSLLARPLPRFFGLAGLLCSFALMPLIPLFVLQGWPETHDHTRYVLLLDQFQLTFRDGILYPRWFAEFGGRYGYPTFVYYQPGFFFAALPFVLLGLNYLLALVSTFFCFCLAGATGAYLAGKQIAGKAGGLLASFFFMLTPYIFVNLYVRGDLSEFAAMLLTPWPLYFLLRLDAAACKGRRSFPVATGLGLTLAAVVYAHPITGFFFTLTFGLAALCFGLRQSRRARRLLWTETAWGMALGLALSSPYWFTVLQMTHYVSVERAFTDYYQAKLHVVHPFLLVSRAWGFGESQTGLAAGMPLQLGLAHALAAATGALAARSDARLRTFFFLYLGLVLFMTPLATLAWTLPILKTAQFPWRLLSVTGALQALCAAGLGLIMNNDQAAAARPWRQLLACGLLALAVLWWCSPQFKAIPYHEADKRSLPQHWIESERAKLYDKFTSLTGKNEFLPKTADLEEIGGPRGKEQVLNVNAGQEQARIEALPGNTVNHIRYRVVVPDSASAAAALLGQLYLPGWRVAIDGHDIPRHELESRLQRDGLIRFTLPAGVHSVEASYEGPPGWLLRNFLILAVVLGFVGRGVFLARQTSAAPRDE